MAAGAQHVALPDRVQRIADGHAALKLRDHGRNAVGADKGRLRMAQQQLGKRAAVIRLHVLHDEIIQRTSVQAVRHVFKKDLADRGVDRVKQDGFFVQQQIGIVGNAVRNGIDALKQRQTAVVAADPEQVVLNLANAIHKNPPEKCGADIPLSAPRGNLITRNIS